jgi:hypothetical protein
MGRWFNRRSHDKMVLADIAYPERSVAITGGRNLSIVYYALPEYTAKTYNDAEVLKRDDVVNNKTGVMLEQTIGAHFNQLFYHKGNLVLTPNTWESTDNRQFKRMDKVFSSLLLVGSDVAKKIH